MIKSIKQWISNVKYNWSYLGVLNSPFVGLRLKWYFGKIQHGTPYFLPRKWVELKEKPGYKTTIQIKYFGWNSTTLGWKTKWYNYRFEWAPCYSLVIFGKQLFVCVLPRMESKDDFCIRQDCYWEAWLTYNYRTDKTKSKTERLQETIKQYSCTWGNKKEGYTDYYPLILKKKYIKL